MRHPAFVGALFALALGGFAATETSSAARWQTYHNPTFGYSVSYPADVFGDPAPTEESDGAVLNSRDARARLAFFGALNAEGQTPRAMAESLAAFDEVRQVTYRRIAPNWFVLSGYLAEPEDGDEMIFYWRVNFGPERQAVSGFRLEYPVTQRDPYDRLIGRIGRSLTSPDRN